VRPFNIEFFRFGTHRSVCLARFSSGLPAGGPRLSCPFECLGRWFLSIVCHRAAYGKRMIAIRHPNDCKSPPLSQAVHPTRRRDWHAWLLWSPLTHPPRLKGQRHRNSLRVKRNKPQATKWRICMMTCLCCWVCGNPIDLKNCKIDEQGLAVHPWCYLRLIVTNQPNPLHCWRGERPTEDRAERPSRR
jgi:hypothetical protein